MCIKERKAKCYFIIFFGKYFVIIDNYINGLIVDIIE